MHYPAAHTFGDAAPSRLPPERVPTDCSAYRDMESAPEGALADPASKPFSLERHTPAGREHPRPASESPANQTERGLLAAIATGNRAAFRQFYFLYFPQLAKFFSHVVTTSSPHVIEELIAEAMLRIWHESATLAKEKSAHVSIMRIAYRCGCERLPPYGQPSQLAPRPSARNPGGDRNPQSPWQRLHKILAALPVAERAVTHLVYCGHSRQEVADILGMSCESVDTHLASARIALDPWLASRTANAPGAALGT